MKHAVAELHNYVRHTNMMAVDTRGKSDSIQL